MQMSGNFLLHLYIFRMLPVNRLKSYWKDDKTIVSIIWGNMEGRILVPSLDLLQDKNYFYFNSARLWDSGSKIGLCSQNTQLCGTGFLLLCERKLLLYRVRLSSLFLTPFAFVCIWYELSGTRAVLPQLSRTRSCGIGIHSGKDLFSGLPAVYFHGHLNMLFYKWWDSRVRTGCFFFFF